MHPCDRPSRAHALPVCPLKSAKSQAFHLTTLCLMICSTGRRGPLCQRWELNPSEPSWFADSTGHQCVLRNLVTAIHSCLKTASSSFLGWPQRQVDKTPKMVIFTCCSCYMLLNNTTNTLKATAHGFIGLSITISVKMDCQHNIYMKEA